jgi:hypothetical protein
MKMIMKRIWILMACVIALGLGIGVRALITQRDVKTEAAIIEQPVYAAESELDEVFAMDTEPTAEFMTEVIGVVTDPIEPGMDLKRGSFLTDEIVVQLDKIVAEKTVGSVWVGASQIVQGDTRAFVKICMALEGSEERLMFGGPIWLDFPGGTTDAFFVHNDLPDEAGAACQVLEFVGVSPDSSQEGWRFNMESVMFVLPDEGTECSVYQKRAEADQALRKAGITVACNEGEGMTNLEITDRPEGLSEAEAQEMVDSALVGHRPGPWYFELPMEPGLVQPNG